MGTTSESPRTFFEIYITQLFFMNIILTDGYKYNRQRYFEMNAQSGIKVKDGESRVGSLVLFLRKDQLTISWSFLYA